MSDIKVVKDTWVVEETTYLDELTIEEGGSIVAPEGKVLALSVDGRGFEANPGYYYGNVVISVAEPYMLAPSCIFRDSGRWSPLRAAVVVKDGKLVEGESMPAHIVSGEISGKSARDFAVTTIDPHFNGLVIAGDTDYLVDNAYMAFEGKGDNDFEGCGAGIACYDNARVNIRNSRFHFNAVTRCTVHCGGDSIVRIENSELRNDSPHTDMRPAWVMGLDGTNRAIQLCDRASVEFINCDLKSNGWGVISVDGTFQTRMLLKDTRMELSGTRARGYGAFIFGDCKAEFDHCEINVNGYPLLINTERNAIAKVTGGTVITAPLYGTMFFRDEAGTLIMDKGSVINSRQACLVFKASNSFCYLDDVSLNAENGVICQMMDNDDPGVMVDHFCPPVDEIDTPIEGRDLTTGDKSRDVFLYISNSQLKGDFLNSSTNLKANCRVAGNTHFDLNDDALNETIGESLSVSQDLVYQDDETQGAKNLVIELKNASIIGVVSSAVQKYRDGVTRIDDRNQYELTNVIQTPAPAVNNGVILSLDKDSKWVVTGKSYLTALDIAEDAIVDAKRMTVNGVETPIGPGSYRGEIVIE